MASEQLSADVDLASGERGSVEAEEQYKPSFLNRMKAKARKLKSKVKSHGSTEDSPGESPRDHISSGEEDESDSDTIESDQEGNNDEVPYTPLSNAVLRHPQPPTGAAAREAEDTPVGPVTSGRSAFGTQGFTNSDDQSSPVDPALLKAEGPSGHEQAVPTNYSYFNSDPLKAEFPAAQDGAQCQKVVPSSLGEEFAGLMPTTPLRSSRFSAQDESLPKSGKSDTDVSQTFMGSQDVKQSDLEANSTRRSSIKSQPEQDGNVKFPEPSSISARTLPEPSSRSALTPRNSLNDSPKLARDDVPSQSVLSNKLPTANPVTDDSVTDGSSNDRPRTTSEDRQALGHANIGKGEGAKEDMDANLKTPSEEATWTETANGLKNSLASTFGYSGNSPDSIPVSQKGRDSAVPVKDLSAKAIDSGNEESLSDSTPVLGKASVATLSAREAELQKTNPDHQGKGLTDSITESIVSLPGKLSSTLGLGGDSPASPSPTSAKATQPTDDCNGSSDAATAGTPTSNSPYDSSTRKDTPYPEHPSATTTGLFDRMSDIASSLFGLGAKQPTTDLGKASSLESKSI